MGIVIGIDVGGSTTKIVGVEDKKIKNPMFVKATDPVTSLFGAFGKYIYNNNTTLEQSEVTSLNMAVNNGNIEIIKLLLSNNNIDVNIPYILTKLL